MSQHSSENTIPIVLVFAGTDPSGGAGIQADIETLSSMGSYAVPVITAITVQNTLDIVHYEPVNADLIMDQARCLLEDISIAAIKIGMLGSTDAVEVIHQLLIDYHDIPVILDPIMHAGGGSPLADDGVLASITEDLIPLTTILTPNSQEARVLAPRAENLADCAQALLDQGCKNVLITGTHEDTPTVVNTFYTDKKIIESFQWDRLPGSYHGSGCTLSAAIAALVAQGVEPLTAVHEAQEYTWESLAQAHRIGKGQLIPNRLFWAHDATPE
ncbi:MAG: bifunctional hydroxymethylpyrimidine kinase/phosphomethylpyrimidine kinase [Thiohalomonadales bacterium]